VAVARLLLLAEVAEAVMIPAAEMPTKQPVRQLIRSGMAVRVLIPVKVATSTTPNKIA
jgi:hypothetical protein